MRLRAGFQILNLLVHALTLLGRAQTHSPLGVMQAQLGLRKHSWGCASTVGVSTGPLGVAQAQFGLTQIQLDLAQV